MKLSHILHPNQFDRSFLDYLFLLTDTIRKFGKSKEGMDYLGQLLSHKRAMLYFTQPSTRTFISFQSACHILGMRTSEIRDPSTSSESKGESIEDSLRTFSSYVNLIIMRSPIPGLCNKIAHLLDETPRPVPIVNAGSGPDQHPTQALLDLYTLYRNFRTRGGIEGKTVCFVGDLKRGRTIRSLAMLLAHYPKVHLIFCSPVEMKMEQDLRDFLKNESSTITFTETTAFEESLKKADAIYMTRIQREYFTSADSQITPPKMALKYEHLPLLKKDAVILHPMPRREELDPRVDLDPRAKYWRQERNGMWTRTALLTMIFQVHRKILMPEL